MLGTQQFKISTIRWYYLWVEIRFRSGLSDQKLHQIVIGLSISRFPLMQFKIAMICENYVGHCQEGEIHRKWYWPSLLACRFTKYESVKKGYGFGLLISLVTARQALQIGRNFPNNIRNRFESLAFAIASQPFFGWIIRWHVTKNCGKSISVIVLHFVRLNGTWKSHEKGRKCITAKTVRLRL